MHPIGTVPTDKMHTIGTVPTDKIHPVWTLNNMQLVTTILMDKMYLIVTLFVPSYFFMSLYTDCIEKLMGGMSLPQNLLLVLLLVFYFIAPL